MKAIYITLVAIALLSCRDAVSQDETPAINDEQVQEMVYMNYGQVITADKAMTARELQEAFKTLKDGDTINVKVKGTMESVCVNKGCWADLTMGDQTASVKFKDYGFFVPKNAAGKEAIFNGIAFKSVTTVDELRHYAEDAGKSKEEITAITEDKVTLSILADGALVEKFDNPDVIIPAPKKL